MLLMVDKYLPVYISNSYPALRQSFLYSLDDLAGGKLGFDNVAVDTEVLEFFGGFFVTKVSEDDNWDILTP
mgnify:FL=1